MKALNEYYQLGLDLMTQFKLAALAHLDVQGNGSCGDIAASCFGGWIAFSTFDHPWVIENFGRLSIAQLVEQDWPGLSIRPLKAPKALRPINRLDRKPCVYLRFSRPSTSVKKGKRTSLSTILSRK